VRFKQWFGCYGGTRADLFTAQSNRHPAKMVISLCFRIFEHGRSRGYWTPGDLILDPMCGIATTLVVGGSLGYRTVGVELESWMIPLAAGNIDRLMENMPGAPRPVVIQGDARHLREVLAGAGADGCLSSPPYTSEFREQHPGTKGGKVARELERGGSFRGYSGTVTHYSGAVTFPPYAMEPRQGGADKHPERMEGGEWQGKYSGAVTSPPYADSIASNKATFDPARFMKAGGPNSQANIPSRYSHDNTAQIGNLKDPKMDIDGILTSPPYAEALTGGGIAVKGHFDDAKLSDRQYTPNAHGKDAAQIANLKDPKRDIDGILTSPPYADTDTNTWAMANQGKRFDQLTTQELEERNKAVSFGRHGYRSAISKEMAARGNLGCLPDKGQGTETYLGAMLQVYRELHAVLKAGGIVALVTKNPVKAGQIRRLDSDTIRLMETAGFTLIERVRAMLSEDLGEQMTLDGEIQIIRREHKSFFKRLYERKRPDLRVDYEDVMFFRKH